MDTHIVDDINCVTSTAFDENGCIFSIGVALLELTIFIEKENSFLAVLKMWEEVT